MNTTTKKRRIGRPPNDPENIPAENVRFNPPENLRSAIVRIAERENRHYGNLVIHLLLTHPFLKEEL